MAIEAPISRYKKNNLKIYIFVCIVFAVWFGYDGYFNEKFKAKHTDETGKPDSTLVFNQKSPPFFLGAAVLLAGYLFAITNRKITADENELLINHKQHIPYDSIEKIDKTYFDSKGFFIITYKNETGRQTDLKLSDRTYDNLGPVLDQLIAKIA